MRSALLLFSAGIVIAHQLPVLPPVWLLPVVVVAGLLCMVSGLTLFKSLIKPVCYLTAGAALAVHGAIHLLDDRLPAARAGEVVSIAGRIQGIPHTGGASARFILEPVADPHGYADNVRQTLPERLRVSWYGAPPGLEAGSVWRFQLRLRPVRGRLNPGGFDGEGFDLLAGVGGHGVVVYNTQPQLLQAGQGLDRLRQRLSERIRRHIVHADAAALAVALGVGDRQYIGPDLRRRLQRTGTAHLVAISGLHIGLVSGGTWLLAAGLWRLLGGAARRYPAQLAAVVPAGLAGLGYAALAGFALPTQRALLMLALVYAGLLMRRRLSPWRILLLALAGVLLLDPLAPLGAGLWLSFGAVAALLLLLQGRRHNGAGESPWRSLQHFLWLQLALLAALAPLTLWWFGQVAWVAPLANSLAIGLVGSLAVPLLLTGLAVSLIHDAVGGFLLAWSGWLLQLLDAGLTLLVDALPAENRRLAPPAALMLCAVLGSVLLLLPRGLPGKAGGLCLLALAMVWQSPVLPAGQGRAVLLDAGHGHALIIRTRRHALLYDTGPAALGRELGAVLQGEQIRRLDKLILSNARAGSIGGVDRLALPAARIIGHGRDAGCRDIPPWTWDQVRFSFLDGQQGVYGHCALLVEAGADRLLVAHNMTPGSLSALASASVGPVTWLVAPRHGHRAGLGAGVAAALAPGLVLIPIDAGNRFGLPHAEGLHWWRDAGAGVRSTGVDGAITLHLGTGRYQGARSHGRYWHRRPL